MTFNTISHTKSSCATYRGSTSQARLTGNKAHEQAIKSCRTTARSTEETHHYENHLHDGRQAMIFFSECTGKTGNPCNTAYIKTVEMPDQSSSLDFLEAITALAKPRPEFLISSMTASLALLSSSYFFCKPSTNFLKSASAVSIFCEDSSTNFSKSAAAIAWYFSIKAFLASSHRSRFAGPQEGPKLASACFWKSARVRPPL